MTQPLKAYRIVKTKWREKALDGDGAKLFGGRWNSKGKACVYCASTEALAQLEMLVHLQHFELLQHYTLLELTLATNQIMRLDTLPDNWRADPAPAETATIGDEWLRQAPSVALQVPSAIATNDNNILLNPTHKDFSVIKASAKALSFQFDPRLK